MSAVMRFGRGAAIIVLALGYAFLAHYTNTRPHVESLGSVIALAPIMLVMLSMAWHARRRYLMLALYCLVCVMLAAVWTRIGQYYGMLYWLEHAGTQLALCLVFGRTLRHQREPLCAYFARMVHGALVPELAQYARQITRVWAVFFAVMAAVSTLLFFTVPIQTWSAFANFFTGPLIGLMFVVEYAVRKVLLPNIKHAHFLDGIKAFWKQPAR